MLIDRRLIRHFDFPLLGFALAIPCVGLLVLYSAGYDVDGRVVSVGWLPFAIRSVAFAKQLIYVGAGLIPLLIVLSLPPNLINRYAYIIYGVCLGLVAYVLKFGVVVNNSRRWISFGAFNLQPSEVMKLALILAMARYLSKNPPKPGGYGFLELFIPFSLFLVPAALIAPQPDLGTALTVVVVGLAMVLFMGIRWKALVSMAVAVALALVPAWYSLHDYQRRRVLVLIDPNVDPKGSGYHIIQSKIAVGSGKFFGKGFLEGTQSQLEFVPEHTTDFIFSVLAEEWGFFGCMVLIGLYSGFLYRLLRVVGRSRDMFSCLAAFGVASLFCFHATVNIGMVVGLLPVVGIPLPLVSYGGSAVLTALCAIGVALGISMRRLIFVGR